ncbi:hypothetical protein PV02_10610 [Methanolobus chelungpuianus]|uniref:PGF-CTERM archaeal protein-sorting signal domain-containing protein n=2 Tax=Methanolobus chelungpuianus TaxID=502115 RepID=A0AAE3HBH7_9EURY|nr:hypothetical protein [Methanolobus chelungpuianus]
MIVLLVLPIATARPAYLEAYRQQYDIEGTRLDACLNCHLDPNGGGPRNLYGLAYAESGRDFGSIEAVDSDGDGFTNLEEINALTFPGDPADHPRVTSDNSPEAEANITDPADSPEQETSEETGSDPAPEQQSPAFGALLAMAGLLSAVYLVRR